MKLTAKQKANIVSAYAAGGISYSTLAAKYGVSKDMIFRIVREAKEDGDFQTQQDDIKNGAGEEAKLSMMEFLKSRAGKAQNLIDLALDLSTEDVRKASVRDRMGLVKILSETFAPTTNADAAAKNALDNLCDAIKEGVKDA